MTRAFSARQATWSGRQTCDDLPTTTTTICCTLNDTSYVKTC